MGVRAAPLTPAEAVAQGRRQDAHRFCGAPIAQLVGRPTSWCAEHLLRVTAARSAGGVSLAESGAGKADPVREAWMRRGWAGTRAAR